MSFRATVAAIFVLANSCSAADHAATMKSLQGPWKLTAAELAGQPLGGDFTKSTKLTIEGDRYTVMVGNAPDKGTLRIDAAKSPMTMDIVGVEGPNKSKTIPAIFEIKDDTMRICYDLSGAARPTEFKSKPESKLFLATYKRDK